MTDQRPYFDRTAAGKVLARHFSPVLRQMNAVVLGLPRGGVPVAHEIARAFALPLDVIVVRKLGIPGQPELALGAIASGGHEVLNEKVVASFEGAPAQISEIRNREQAELHRREILYRRGLPPIEISGRVIILVDDGVATGATMRVAIGAVRKQGAPRIIVAVPVGARETCFELSAIVDELICPLQPEPLEAVGLWYEKFAATTDDEVQKCLTDAAAQAGHVSR